VAISTFAIAHLRIDVQPAFTLARLPRIDVQPAFTLAHLPRIDVQPAPFAPPVTPLTRHNARIHLPIISVGTFLSNRTEK